MVLVPFLALFFAIFDFSMSMFLKNTMQFAVRQGVRYAVTSRVVLNATNTSIGHDASIRQIVRTNSMGFLDYLAPSGFGRPCSGDACITIRYYDPSTLLEVTSPTANTGGNIVKVSAENLSWAWMVPLLRSASPLNFSVSSADMMEASPNGIPPAR